MTFLCGQAGVCALGAVAAKHAGDDRLLGHYVTQFKEVVDFTEFYLPMMTFCPEVYYPLFSLDCICFSRLSRLNCLVTCQMSYYMEKLGSYGPLHS